MTQGLSVSRFVNVDVVLSPLGAAVRNFGLLLVVGDSDVISGAERIRSYSGIDGVAEDFGVDSPEYKAALLYFSVSPQPDEILIGRWLRTATAGFLDGGALSASEKLISAWTSIDDGSFTISFDGNEEDVTGLDFTAQTTLNGVAAVITAGLSGGTVTWDGTKFIAKSDTTGTDSTVSYATSEGTGTDISAQLKLTSATASAAPVDGYDSETPLEAITALYNQSSDWYIASFAAATMPTDDELVDVAGFIQAANISRVLFCTDQASGEFDPIATDLLSQRLRDLSYNRSASQASLDNPYALCSMAGTWASVDFTGSNTAKTYMFKTEPGVVPEYVTETQMDFLTRNRCNVYANVNNGTAIFLNGVMSSELYMDERQGFDWMQNAIQVAIYNLLYQNPKIAQTDSGVTQIVAAVAAVLNQGVTNGLIAPGIWSGPSFGNITTGQQLELGYAIYAPSVASQSQADREARKSPLIQCAVKLAGAIQTVDIQVNVNR